MVQIVRAPDPELHPGVERSQEKQALWAAFPAAVISFDGTILAANKLASWIAGIRAPARQLLSRNIYDLSARLVVENRIPIDCNQPFITKKLENLQVLDPAQAWPAHRTFLAVMEVVKGWMHEGDGVCPPFDSARSNDEQFPWCWQYPLRMRQPDASAGDELMEFAVVEARLARGRHFLIIFEPDGQRTRSVLQNRHRDLERLYPGEDYAFAMEEFDIKLGQEYIRYYAQEPAVEIIDIDDMTESEKADLSYIQSPHVHRDSPEMGGLAEGMPLVGLRAKQSLGPDDIQTICAALDAVPEPEPPHPILGPSMSFRLKAEPMPGRVSQVDLFLQMPAWPQRALVRVRRLDHLGDWQDQRFPFDAGYHHASEPSALSLVETNERTRRAVVVFSSGSFAEAPEEALRFRSARAGVPAAEPKQLASGLPAFEVKHAVSTAEAAARLGISRMHLHRLMERGDVRGVQVGGTWIVDGSDLGHWRPNPRGRPRSTRP